MTRLLLVLLCIVFFVLAIWGMRVGWRHRAGRQAGLAPRPSAPTDLGPTLAPELVGVYVGSTYATSWQDRITAQGLGLRANASARITAAGVIIDREGTDVIFIPDADIVEARLAPALAGKVVGAGGLVVIRWRLGETEIDTGLRGDEKTLYPQWIHQLNGKAPVA